MVLTFLTYRIKNNEEANLREVIATFHTNKDNSITFNIFKEGINQLNIDYSTIKDIFNSIDRDKSGKIEYTAFITATLGEKLYLKRIKTI